MRAITKVLTAATAVGLAATMAACSSSGSSGGSGNTGGSQPTSKTPTTSSAPTTSAAPKPVGAFNTLTKGTTTVVPAKSFTSALSSLGVKLGLEGKAKMTSQGIAFPITGGNATIYKKGTVTPYVQGVVKHNGSGLTLSAGGTTVALENFVINPGNNSNLTGKVLVNGKQAFPAGTKLFDLDGNTLKTPTISGGYATLQGTTIYVSQAAAGALNKVFKLAGTKKALPTGFEKIEVGTAIIHVTGK